MKPGVLLVRNAAEADELAGQVRASATKLQSWIASFGGDGIGLLRALKFDQVGVHPLDGNALNAIEQVNQIWTYFAELSAVRVLFKRFCRNRRRARIGAWSHFISSCPTRPCAA